MSSRGQSTRCDLTPWELGIGLTTPHRGKVIRYELFMKASELIGYFGETLVMCELYT
jgi:hypothetical protein